MSDSIKKLNLNIEKLISEYFFEKEKLIKDVNKENEELRSKIKELEYELKLSQLKVENLELKLELCCSNEDSSNCDDFSVKKVGNGSNKRKFGKRLFANFDTSQENICSEIIAADTCGMFDKCGPVMKTNPMELSVVYESQFPSGDHHSAEHSSRDDQLNIETQLSQEEDMPPWSDCEIDLDETVIDCGQDDDENNENENPINSNQKIADRSIKYVGPTVRKKTERQALVGFDCMECRKYYEALGETDSQIQSRIQHCSKHRARYVPPSTPEGFWDIGIAEPATEPEVKLIKLSGRRGKKMQLPDRKWIQ